LGLYEHLKGLQQTTADEESWVTDAKVKTRLGVEPDLTPPPWMASIQQQAAVTTTALPPAVLPSDHHQPPPPRQQQRRASRYPAMAMSFVNENSPLG